MAVVKRNGLVRRDYSSPGKGFQALFGETCRKHDGKLAFCNMS